MSDKKDLVDSDLIRELADLLTETSLTEIEIERDGTRVRVVRASASSIVHAPVPAPSATATGGAAKPAGEPASLAAGHM